MEYDEIKNAVNYARFLDMKIKYMNFIQAFKTGDTRQFVEAACKLAENDITDILFTYKSDDERALEEKQPEEGIDYSLFDDYVPEERDD